MPCNDKVIAIAFPFATHCLLPIFSFVAGASADDLTPGQSCRDCPQWRDRLARRFAIGRFEITARQWRDGRADGGCIARRARRSAGCRSRVLRGGLEDSAYVLLVSSRIGLNADNFARSNGVRVARTLRTRPP